MLSHVPHKQSRNYNDDSYGYLNIQKEEVIRKKDTSNNTIDLSLSDNVNAEMQSDLNCSISNAIYSIIHFESFPVEKPRD